MRIRLAAAVVLLALVGGCTTTSDGAASRRPEQSWDCIVAVGVLDLTTASTAADARAAIDAALHSDQLGDDDRAYLVRLLEALRPLTDDAPAARAINAVPCTL